MSIVVPATVRRWLVPASAALAVIGGGVAIGAITNAADPSLPQRSAAELLVDLQTARVDGMSGTVVASADLGLPALLSAGPAAPFLLRQNPHAGLVCRSDQAGSHCLAHSARPTSSPTARGLGLVGKDNTATTASSPRGDRPSPLRYPVPVDPGSLRTRWRRWHSRRSSPRPR
jgi:hypothetical protein